MDSEHQTERRIDPERLVRLETVVERLQMDVTSLITTYQDVSDRHQAMFVEAVKSSTQLQASLEKLNETLSPVVLKVAEHDKVMWKGIGILSSILFVMQVTGWLFIHH